MSRATTALLDADVHLAESVIAADDQLDAIRTELDALSIDLLARQQPVATDLRIVVTSMRMSADLERMGDLARHVAKVARLRYPDSRRAAALCARTSSQMGQVAERIVAKAGFGHRHQGRRPRRSAWSRTTTRWTSCTGSCSTRCSTTRPTSPRETAVDLTLLGRYYERFADHAVSVAHRVVYLVTGRVAAASWTLPELDHEEHREDSRVAAGLSGLPAGAQRPWLATAAAASAAASGSR